MIGRIASRAAAAFTIFLSGAATADSPLLAPTRDETLYRTAIAAERPAEAPPAGVTGIMVPHHLVAADLMARAFWAASAGDYDRIILLSPDHFRAVDGAFGVSEEAFDTIFGPLDVDLDSVGGLLAHPTLFERLSSEEVAAEHGFHAVAPMIASFWPDARVIPVLGSIHSDLDDWRAAATALAPLMTERTLIVQSTDFSHYLPRAQAVLRDEESLGVIAAASAEEVRKLNQPRHLDSKASMAVHTLLQSGLEGAPVVIGNRNQAEYGGEASNTTSYVSAIWHRDRTAGARLRYDDQTILYLAGDFFTGRYFEPHLAAPDVRDVLIDEVLSITQSAPLIVNFEGAMLADRVVGAPPAAHLMRSGLTTPILRALNVVAASLANNHANDLGADGEDMTQAELQAAGVMALRRGEVRDLGPVRIAAFSLLGLPETPEEDPRAAQAIETICLTEAAPPLVVFVHWGEEYTRAAGHGERRLAARLSACGATAIIGHHSHQASHRIDLVRGGGGRMVYSLGNFLFDQRADRADGALAELRIFSQGTTALRLVPIPNLFERARSLSLKN